MSSERDETETAPHMSTAPSTPATDANKMSRILESLPLSPGLPAEVQPDHPLRFSHLLASVVRTDLQAYGEFSELLKTSRAINNAYHGRTSSKDVSSSRSSSAISSNPAASTSSPHLPGSFNSPATPSAGSPRDPQASPLPPLKDSKFFKRSLTEDIEPTLRLDLAPGLSWLARRTVLTSITTGALVIEPFVAPPKLYAPIYPCSLCGEERRQDMYARKHRFRTSEDPTAQRHPLCEYCLTRLRATCDFAAFLRMCRDGTWKTANDEDIKSAWDEAVRLRERMFWSRIGGGVIPAAYKELHAQSDANRDKVRKSGESTLGKTDSLPSEDEAVTLKQPTPIIRLASPPHKSLPPTPKASKHQDEESEVMFDEKQSDDTKEVEAEEEAKLET